MDAIKAKDKYGVITPNSSPTLWEIIELVATQGINEKATVALSSQVLPAGRYVERAVGSERAPRKSRLKMELPQVEAIIGVDSYLRPNGAIYYARSWGEHQDVMALRNAKEATKQAVITGVGSPMFPMFYGAPGTGKTALVEATFGAEMRTLVGHGDIEVSDLIGSYVQTPSGNFEWVDGDLIKCMENGWVYFIDEIGLIDPKVLAILYGTMDGRRELVVSANPERGVIKAHPDFFVVSATNPNAPGVRISEALTSRFTLQVEMTTDYALAKKLGVPSLLITSAQNLYRKQLDNQISWSPQMRELLAFRDIATTFGTAFALANLISSSPESDRATIADVLSRAFGEEVKPAKI
jgi:nitric oxide reductase NorQ protein